MSSQIGSCSVSASSTELLPTAAVAHNDTASALLGRRRDAKGIVFQLVMLSALVIALIILVSLILRLFSGSGSVLTGRLGDFLSSGTSSRPERAGVWQGIWGSMMIAFLVVILSFPIGVAAAIYLEEYAKPSKLTRLISVNVRNLAGVPSVVYGLLGLAIFNEQLRGLTGGPSVLAAGLTVAVLVLPIVIITASEALRAVPRALREAGYGVGATRWEVTKDHTLPSAGTGIITGLVLALARAIGEAAPVLLVGAVNGFFKTPSNANIVDQMQGKFTALPVMVFTWASQPKDEFRELAAAGSLVTLVIVLSFATLAIILRQRFDTKGRR
jgi:phosphate transport system permease protein